MRTTTRARLLAFAVSAALAGCGDPYRDRLIDNLPAEDPAFAPGELHRPGQPCVACHSSYGGAPEFAVGGTLFAATKVDEVPAMLSGYTVRVHDSEGRARDALSNGCGNFFIRRDDWDPAFPLLVEILAGDPAGPTPLVPVSSMGSRIAREGSCGGCHIGRPSPISPGIVAIPGTSNASPNASSAGTCPSPWLGPDPHAPVQGAK
jgi:mono/diheme cytochrome c family protein